MRVRNIFAAFAIASLILAAAPSARALDPATWQKIATLVAAYFQSQEGQCQIHACNCDKCNQGAKNKCHEVTRRINAFIHEPNDYNAGQVYDITGSKRTVCMAKRLMGESGWSQFDAYRGK